jgi:heme oxygenase
MTKITKVFLRKPAYMLVDLSPAKEYQFLNEARQNITETPEGTVYSHYLKTIKEFEKADLVKTYINQFKGRKLKLTDRGVIIRNEMEKVVNLLREAQKIGDKSDRKRGIEKRTIRQ